MTTPATPATPGTPATPATAGIADASASSMAAAASSIQDLTSQMTQLTQYAQAGTDADLRLSDAAHKTYIDLISTFRNTLTEQRAEAAALANYGDVGGLRSANQTKFNLTYDITGPDGYLAVMDNLHSYLDQHEKFVNAVFARTQAEDNAT